MTTNETLTAWFRGRIPDGWYAEPVTVRADRDEILVIGVLTPPELGDDLGPDGQRVAYRRIYAGAVEIWIAPLSGEAPMRFWADPARVPQRGPSWSPDGNWLAFYSARDGKTAVLKARVGAGIQPAPSPHGAPLDPSGVHCPVWTAQ